MTPHMMMTIILECEDGELIGQVTMPYYKFPPSVVTWGTRVFRIYQELTYREVVSYSIPLEALR